jgi:hypothetical protein
MGYKVTVTNFMLPRIMLLVLGKSLEY